MINFVRFFCTCQRLFLAHLNKNDETTIKIYLRKNIHYTCFPGTKEFY